MLPTVVAIIAIALLLFTLGAIVRFSIVSPWRTRGSGSRLRQPDSAGVEQACGFAPPADLVRLYQDGVLTGLVECSLVDTSRQPNKVWFFGGFYPLTEGDVLEQKRIHGLKEGIPIADDMAKGLYFVSNDGRVMFRAPGSRTVDVEVAPSAEVLSRFEVKRGETNSDRGTRVSGRIQ